MSTPYDRDPGALVLDERCALESLRRFVAQPAGEPPRETLMPALAHLSCGHRRPCNVRLEQGDLEWCLLCGMDAGLMEVERLEMLDEPLWFPTPDALSDLPGPT